MGGCTILDHQFLELERFGIGSTLASTVFSRDELRLKCEVLHLHLFILLPHLISKTFSLLILHQTFAIELVADVVVVILGHWLDGSQSLRYWLSACQCLTRSVKALLPSWSRLLLHDGGLYRPLAKKRKRVLKKPMLRLAML